MVAEYRLKGGTVRLLNPSNGGATLYWLSPDEFGLSPSELSALRDAAAFVRRSGGAALRSIPLGEARRFVTGQAAAFLDGRAADAPPSRLSRARAATLAQVVSQYTVGLGILEHLLEDRRVTDAFCDAPVGETPLYVSLSLPDERLSDRLTTNITLTREALAALVTRARLEAGRQFSQARPYLEHDLADYGARLTVVGPPVSPEGLAVALRRHSSAPLTLAQLVAGGALAPLTAGLLSVMVEGQCSLLIGGARGAGKTTLLGALMLEMDPCKRIITIEDTLELPVAALRDNGYRVQSLRVRSALGGEGEMSSEDALRLSLRLGESAIVVGEVRGAEAQTLYEAMRTGAAGSAVMGTIHGSPASAVCARAVHDLGVSPESFASTDAIIVAGLVRPGGARRQVRRVTEIGEVECVEGSLVLHDLLRPTGPSLEPTDATLAESRVVTRIAAAWGVAPTEVVREVKARAELKLRQVALGQALANPDIIAARATMQLNTEYARARNDGLRGPALVQAVINFARRKWA
jgi:type IV secretory pathway ATPase VirB11/archaellum biosynthesis ATPase